MLSKTEGFLKPILDKSGNAFNIKLPLPMDFQGIPVLLGLKSWFFAYRFDRRPEDVPLPKKAFTRYSKVRSVT